MTALISSFISHGEFPQMNRSNAVLMLTLDLCEHKLITGKCDSHSLLAPRIITQDFYEPQNGPVYVKNCEIATANPQLIHTGCTV